MDALRQEAKAALTDRYEIRLAGEGGQGMILAGVILAEAAVQDNLNAVQTQSYGPEARGGASRSEVVIAHGQIDYPKVMAPDLLLCMSQEACDKFYGTVKDSGCILVDSASVSRIPSHRGIAVPISKLAQEVTGRRITASIVGLGMIAGLTHVVSLDALGAAVRERVPRGTEEMNLKALRAGFEEGERLTPEQADSCL
jgi:2-oxoglutarate ferredoxin oxidoreductase subunit gamma